MLPSIGDLYGAGREFHGTPSQASSSMTCSTNPHAVPHADKAPRVRAHINVPAGSFDAPSCKHAHTVPASLPHHSPAMHVFPRQASLRSRSGRIKDLVSTILPCTAGCFPHIRMMLDLTVCSLCRAPPPTQAQRLSHLSTRSVQRKYHDTEWP